MSTHCHATTPQLEAALAHSALIAAEADEALKKADEIQHRYVGRHEVAYEDEVFIRIAQSGNAEDNLREFFAARDALDAVPEYEAGKALETALLFISSPADVAAVVEHAELQGRRPLGGSETVYLHRLIDVLTVKLYGSGISAD